MTGMSLCESYHKEILDASNKTKEDLINEQLKLIDELVKVDKKAEKMKEEFRKMAHYADAVKKVLAEILPDDPKGCLVCLTMEKISEIAEANGR